MPATTPAAAPSTGSAAPRLAAHLRVRARMSAAPRGEPSFTASETTRRTQAAASSPARRPSPRFTRSLAVGPSSHPMTTSSRLRSNASSGGTRAPDWPASPAACKASYSAASELAPDAYALTANRRLATRPHGRASGRMVGAPEEQDAARLRQGACQHATRAAARDGGETEGRESIPWCAAATECGLAPHPLVYEARQVRHQVVGDAILLDAAGEHDQDVASSRRRGNHGGVVVHDLADPSGLVGHAGPRRHAHGDPLVELLAAEDGEHRVAGGGARGTAGRDRLEQHAQVARRRRVVQPGSVRRAVFHAA